MFDTNKFSTPVDFLINLPLYEVVELQDDKDLAVGMKLYYFDETIDSYCPECNKHSIFSPAPYYGSRLAKPPIDHWVNQGKFEVNLQCSRDKQHRLFFQFVAINNTIQKIGQLPSIASLNLFDVKKYSKILEPKYFKELTKAIGLVSHGVGVGSFVYLRRIFEFLIEEAHINIKNRKDWDEDNYRTSKMSDKIKLLSSELPSFLVENKSMYSILSKGIHELTENECLSAFPVVKVGIEIILDSKLEKANREKKLQEATKAISALNNDI